MIWCLTLLSTFPHSPRPILLLHVVYSVWHKLIKLWALTFHRKQLHFSPITSHLLCMLNLVFWIPGSSPADPVNKYLIFWYNEVTVCALEPGNPWSHPSWGQIQIEQEDTTDLTDLKHHFKGRCSKLPCLQITKQFEGFTWLIHSWFLLIRF